MDLRHGSKIGKFVIVGELGSGGMGVVYVALDPELDRQVALKVMKAAVSTDEDRARMLREGQAMARITHPNVITVYEVGSDGSEGGLVFLAQELLDGGTLAKWLTTRRAHPDVIEKFVAAGRGLAAAHAASLVHRDFKPENVLLGKDGRVRVADFGLASALGSNDAAMVTSPGRGTAPDPELARSPMSPLTRTGAVMGTPMFMAPEQHKGERADERSDQFAFCVALYHALYGDFPFLGKTAPALAEEVIEGRIQPAPKGHQVPARLRKILVRGLATNPADRYPSIEVLLAELVVPPRRSMRGVGISIGAVVLAAGAVVGGYALRSHSSQVAPKPIATGDGGVVTTDRQVEWLYSAIERGQLDDALEKYDLAAQLEAQAGKAPQASIASSSGALVLVLRGKLEPATAHLRDADASKGADPTAVAYADLAAAELAWERGELQPAQQRARTCAKAFTTTVPVLAAMCLELAGEAAADLGDAAAARSAYQEGLGIATREDSPQRSNTLDLATVELDLDAGETDKAANRALAVQASAAARGAVSPEAHAWVSIARARLAQADNTKALEALDHVKPETLQVFRARILHAIALGQTNAALGDLEEGLAKIEAARSDAAQQGYVGLVYEARLARVVVLVVTSAPDAAKEQRALVDDAARHGYGRIARLAATVMQR